MPNTRTNAPRGALVFDTRTLGRQAGSARTQQLTVPAPDDLRLELARVPVGADMHLDVKFEAVTEGVLVTGSATAPLAGECARCLRPLTTSVTASFTELYLYADGRRTHDKHDKHDKHDRRNSREWFDEDTEQDDEERHLDGDLLDLEPVLRDAVVLALPMSTAVPPGLPGAVRRVRRAAGRRGPGAPARRFTDPRWAALRAAR